MKKKLLVLLITLASTMMPNLASAVAISEAQIQRVIEICQALPNCASECQEWLCNAPPPPPNDCDYSSPAGC